MAEALVPRVTEQMVTDLESAALAFVTPCNDDERRIYRSILLARDILCGLIANGQRRYYVLLVDADRSTPEADFVVAKFKQRAYSPDAAIDMVRERRLGEFGGLANRPSYVLKLAPVLAPTAQEDTE